MRERRRELEWKFKSKQNDRHNRRAANHKIRATAAPNIVPRMSRSAPTGIVRGISNIKAVDFDCAGHVIETLSESDFGETLDHQRIARQFNKASRRKNGGD